MPKTGFASQRQGLEAVREIRRIVAAVVASGRVWMEVPETLQVRLVGALPPGTSAHDLVLEIVGRIGADGAAGRALEFVGPALAGLSMEDRLKLANNTLITIK